MRVLYDGPEGYYSTADFEAPVPPLDAGDVVVIARPMDTLGGERYNLWDELHSVGRTDEAPHHRITTEGNLLVRGKNDQVTIWSNIEWMISKGYMNRVSRPRSMA